jgi:hypothetical protein
MMAGRDVADHLWNGDRSVAKRAVVGASTQIATQQASLCWCRSQSCLLGVQPRQCRLILSNPIQPRPTPSNPNQGRAARPALAPGGGGRAGKGGGAALRGLPRTAAAGAGKGGRGGRGAAGGFSLWRLGLLGFKPGSRLLVALVYGDVTSMVMQSEDSQASNGNHQPPAPADPDPGVPPARAGRRGPRPPHGDGRHPPPPRQDAGGPLCFAPPISVYEAPLHFSSLSNAPTPAPGHLNHSKPNHPTNQLTTPIKVWFRHERHLRGFKSPPLVLHDEMLKLHASLKVGRPGWCGCRRVGVSACRHSFEDRVGGLVDDERDLGRMVLTSHPQHQHITAQAGRRFLWGERRRGRGGCGGGGGAAGDGRRRAAGRWLG